MELARPKQNLEIPIEGTQKLKLPKWLPRHELTFFVRYFSRGGAYPIDEALNGMRISFAGEPLPLPKRKAFFRHARIWQDWLLREKSDRGTMNSDSTNQVANYSRNGHALRNTQDNLVRPKKTYETLQRRS